MKHTRQYLQ